MNLNNAKSMLTTIEAQKRLMVFAVLASSATFLIATLYPVDRPVDELTEMSFASAYAWIVAQSMLPSLIIVMAMMMFARWLPKSALWFGVMMLAIVPVVELCDSIAFHWFGERFLSMPTLHIIVSLLPGLLPYASFATIASSILISLGCAGLIWFSWWLSRRVSRSWSTDRENDTTPAKVLGALALVTALLATPALMNFGRTIAEMRDHSTRHPLCALRLIGYRDVGVSVPSGETAIMSHLHGFALADVVEEKLVDYRDVRFAETSTSEKPDQPDALIVIIESLQSTMLSAEVMPNSFRLSNESTRLTNHFSGGNASNLGIFSLLNGIEATWFPYAYQFMPMGNQMFRDAGYELGFFGGSEGWETFGMGGFVGPGFYDRFEIEPVDWLTSDRRAIERTADFLESADGAKSNRKPRLAVLYLYSSHAPFASLPEQSVFQPAVDSYISPYSDAMRDQVWNKYRNSVRSLDHLMSGLLDRNRLIVIVGDHGEAFMEDGTIGHGTRLSRIQNMTSGMIYIPGQAPRVMTNITCHADVIPTLMPVIGMSTEHIPFDGVDLLRQSDEQLRQRVIASCNYVSGTLMLAGPWTNMTDSPFAYRCALSLEQWQVAPLNPIDNKGLQWRPDDPTAIEAVDREFRRWLVQRFGFDPTDDPRSELELFAAYLNGDNESIRLAAVNVASNVVSPSSDLIELISQRTADQSPLVREAARKVVIALQRRKRSAP